jgi:hypothetical protein
VEALHGVVCRPMGTVQVRGRHAPVSVFGIDSPLAQPACPS